MKFKILISLLAVVLVAGCTIPGIDLGIGGTPLGTSGKGLEITSFTAEPSSVYSNSKVRVYMEVENQGGTTIAKEKALVQLMGSNMDLDSGDDRYWTSSDGEWRIFNRSMRTADVVKGTSADSTRFTWSLTSPSLTAGQTRVDTIYGRTYCDYTTAVNGNAWIYTEGESDAAKASGRSINKASFTPTAGPVGLSVKVSPDPVIYYESGEAFDLYITVSNMASGTIYEKDKLYTDSGITIASTEYNIVWVDVDYPDKITLTNPGDCKGRQELPAGKSTTLVCTFTVTTAPTNFESYPISVKADYGYYTERTATVTVQGKSTTSTLECSVDADCDDSNTCTTDTCTSGTCSNIPLADGTPCTGGQCESGVCVPS